jgi:hypothetical protein
LEKLHQAELQRKAASKAMEETRTESLQLNERLLDKENKLQSITQKNDELRACQSKAEEKIVELSSQLKEVVTIEKVREMSEKANLVLDIEIEKAKVEEEESLHRCKEKESNNNVKQEGENGDAKEEVVESKMAENEPQHEENGAKDVKVNLKSSNDNQIDKGSGLSYKGKKKNLMSKKKISLKKNKMKECNSVAIPMELGTKFSKFEGGDRTDARKKKIKFKEGC